jgi:hypothetical protein
MDTQDFGFKYENSELLVAGSASGMSFEELREILNRLKLR